jgi:hypothetical protein
MGRPTSKDARLFFRLHNGFPEHPKTIELSDKAFRQLVETWCFCSRMLNDGKLTKTQFFRFFSSKSRGEVLALRFVVETETGYEMHDYLKHQMSAEDVENSRNMRATAGSKGGKAKANNLANARALASDELKQNASKGVPDKDTDKDNKEADASLGVQAERQQRTKTPTPIPDDFAMTSSMQAWAMRTIGTKHHIDLAIETEKFIAHAGEKNITSSSWPDSWRKWILKAVEFAERDRATAPLGAYGTIEDIKKLYNNRPAREPVEARP